MTRLRRGQVKRPGPVTRAAAGVVCFCGMLAIVGGLLGEFELFLPRSVLEFGALALVVLVLGYGRMLLAAALDSNGE